MCASCQPTTIERIWTQRWSERNVFQSKLLLSLTILQQAVALTCKVWNAIVNDLLLRTIVIRERLFSQSILRFLRKHPQRSSSIKGLFVYPEEEYHELDSIRNVQDVIVPLILIAFRSGNLRALGIGPIPAISHSSDSFNQAERALINSITFRPSEELKSLVFLSIRLEAHTLRDILPVIRDLQSLKSFTFRRYRRHVQVLPLQVVEEFKEMCLPLTSLSLCIFASDIDILFPSLHLPNLSHLSLSMNFEVENDLGLSSALIKLGPQLLSLWLLPTSLRTRRAADIATMAKCPLHIPSILSACSKLRSFAFDAEWNTAVSDDLVLVSTPHPTLRHIHLGGTAFFAMPCLHNRHHIFPSLFVNRNLDAVTKSNFPCLESVSVRVYGKLVRRCIASTGGLEALRLREQHEAGVDDDADNNNANEEADFSGEKLTANSKSNSLKISMRLPASSFLRLVDRCVQNNIAFNDNLGNSFSWGESSIGVDE